MLFIIKIVFLSTCPLILLLQYHCTCKNPNTEISHLVAYILNKHLPTFAPGVGAIDFAIIPGIVLLYVPWNKHEIVNFE